MDGSGTVTTLTNPADASDRKNFSFDYSYWSFDGFTEDAAGRNVADPSHLRGDRYCDQVHIFIFGWYRHLHSPRLFVLHGYINSLCDKGTFV